MGFWHVYFGIYGGGGSVTPGDDIVTRRLTLLGTSNQRLTAIGTSSERMTVMGSSR